MNTIIKQTKVMEPETIQKNGADLKRLTGNGNFRLLTLLAFILLFGIKTMAQGIIP